MVTEKSMSEGLKQKIQKLYDEELADLRKAGTPLDVEVSSGRMELLGKVLGLLDEAAKQIQELFDDTDSRAGDYRVISVVRGLKEEVLAILDGKEKARA